MVRNLEEAQELEVQAISVILCSTLWISIVLIGVVPYPSSSPLQLRIYAKSYEPDDNKKYIQIQLIGLTAKYAKLF